MSRERIPEHPLALPHTPPTIQLQRRVIIDWDHLIARRGDVLLHSTLPPYLLLPEVHWVRQASHDHVTHFLINTLWHTGARISEALQLTPAHFKIDGINSYASLTTLKKKRGRPKRRERAEALARMVPITDGLYLDEIQRNCHGQPKNAPLFAFSRQAASKRLDKLLQSPRLVGRFPINVSLHTFRHAFAINAVLHGIPLTVIQGWLGHRHLETTAIYTQVLSVDTGHLMQQIEY